MDRYTKVVLTVIAIALSVIAARLSVPSAMALGDGCGSYSDPCNVTGSVDVSGTVYTKPLY